jgi:hypothetical protein
MPDNTQNTSGDSTEVQQYLDTLRRGEYLEPEKALLAAILEDAIHQYHKFRHAWDTAGKEQSREAQEWIMHEGDQWIFSFDNVCESLGLDREYLRRGILETQTNARELQKDERPNARKRAA